MNVLNHFDKLNNQKEFFLKERSQNHLKIE